MTETEVRRFIAGGESLTVEFKSDATRLPDADWIETVVCMANYQGGILMVGVEDDGAITGLHPYHQTSPTVVAAFIASRTVPPLTVEVHFVNLTEGTIAVLSIPAVRQPIGTSDGKLLIRYSDTHGKPGCRPLHPHELTGWRADRGTADFTALTITEASWADFDALEFARLRRLVEENRGDKALLELADEEIARALGLVSNELAGLTPTLAGLLLVGKETALRKYLPAHEAAFQVLHGAEVKDKLIVGAANGDQQSYRLDTGMRVDADHAAVGSFEVPLLPAEIEQHLLAHVQRQGRIRREEVETLGGWSRDQAYHWLKRMVAEGKLQQMGRGRAVYYRLASAETYLDWRSPVFRGSGAADLEKEPAMSVTLTYSGRLKSAGMIEPLLQELGALAEEHGWQYELTGPNEHAMLFGPVVVVRGIHLTLAPEAGLFARFTLSFDQDGLLVHENNLQVYSDEKFLRQYMPELAHPVTRKRMFDSVLGKAEGVIKKVSWKEIVATGIFTSGYVRTNRLGAANHILLCKLLRYLGKKYFAALQVDDGGGYWKTSDASGLAESIGLTNFMFDQIGNFFDHANKYPLLRNAGPDDLLKDLSAFAAAAYKNAPYKPIELSKLKNKKPAKSGRERKREK